MLPIFESMEAWTIKTGQKLAKHWDKYDVMITKSEKIRVNDQ